MANRTEKTTVTLGSDLIVDALVSMEAKHGNKLDRETVKFRIQYQSGGHGEQGPPYVASVSYEIEKVT